MKILKNRKKRKKDSRAAMVVSPRPKKNHFHYLGKGEK
jgi:hypothetical protein